MKSLAAISTDGTRIAYDRCGAGPTIILLHGGGGRRQEWHEAGYVRRLQSDFTVVSLDLRGHGESGAPTGPADYVIEKMMQDILAVADACGAEHFILWGMSYGGKVGRYLAAHSARVEKMILVGTPLGLGVTGILRQDAIDFCAHWPPIMQAQRAGVLNLDSLTQHDREMLQSLNIPAMLGWVRAMLDWPAIEPGDFCCPVLWLVGAQDDHAMASLKEYETALVGSKVEVQIVAGLNHEQVFDEIETVFPILLSFCKRKG